MTAALDLLHRAHEAGVELFADGDRLRLRASRQPPAELLDELRAYKAAVLAALTDDGGAFDERVALVADGSGCPEEWAAALARLDPARPPKDVPTKRWRLFLDDCGRFVDEWATKAADLGWTPLDLFGCHREAPYARVDCAGLLWLVAGRRIVALTAETAVIETPGGGRLTYRRRPKINDQAVAPWELAS